MEDFKLLVEKIDGLKLDVASGFKAIDKRLEKLEDNHMEVSTITAKHEERFVNMREKIDKLEKDINLYTQQRREVDVDQYEKLNNLRSKIESQKTESIIDVNDASKESSEKIGNLFFKWIPLIGTILGITFMLTNNKK